MEKFLLSAFLNISGLGAASGIVYNNNSLYIISDNSGFLYQYQLQDNQLLKHPLIENPSENIVKNQKPDLEAITLVGKELHIFGSGSTSNRNKQFTFNLENNVIQENDLSTLYQKIKTKADIHDNELNIEGSFYNNNFLYLLQRGNGEKSKNGIIIVKLNNNFEDIEFQTIQLPKIKHVKTTFTDAILIENKIYFLACAEDTISTYNDGEILGSIIGSINLETFQTEFTHQISNKHKFEGLTLFQKSKTEIVFLLCEDNDTEVLETIIYKVILKL